jgi:alkylation response protein AidB-like acyl-CoA dehydrogenase/SAM-dependent methyltransferase
MTSAQRAPAGAPPALARREPTTSSIALQTALGRIAERAGELDRAPRFPRESIADLVAAGVIQGPASRTGTTFVRQIELVRAVSAADAATGRILDGHFNGIERLVTCADRELLERELDFVRRGELLLGVWGADPGKPSEGRPAHIVGSTEGSHRLRGVKTFCSGAGAVQRALVVARDEDGCRRLAYVDPRIGATVDRSWFRGSGLRASESHRVEFRDTPILAVFGGPDELAREPWFSRDAVRTAAAWAGIVDCIVGATAVVLADGEPGPLWLLTLGEMRVAQATIDCWLKHAGAALSLPVDAEATRLQAADAHQIAGECRIAVATAARRVSAAAAGVGGSRALVGGGPLDRARRDLDLFLLQHRLEPRLVELGSRTLVDAGRPPADLDPAARFERLYEESPDPWGYDTSVYERDKHQATAAALPQRPIGRALDVGCSNGALTVLIADRSEQVTAVDFSSRAILLADRRGLPANVELVQARFPDEIPAGDWDLVVCSEILYYLTPGALLRAVRWFRSRLENGSTVVVVSWRGHGSDQPMRGDDVHDLLADELRSWHTRDARQPNYRLDRFNDPARE